MVQPRFAATRRLHANDLAHGLAMLSTARPKPCGRKSKEKVAAGCSFSPRTSHCRHSVHHITAEMAATSRLVQPERWPDGYGESFRLPSRPSQYAFRQHHNGIGEAVALSDQIALAAS